MRGINIREILLVEDETGSSEITKRLYPLCEKCFSGEVALNSVDTWQAAMEAIRSRPIDVLIADLILKNDVPPLFREDTLHLIAATEGLPPVVVFTGVTDDKFLRDKCILAGADSFFSKLEFPRHPEQLFEKCYDAYLRRQRFLRYGKTA